MPDLPAAKPGSACLSMQSGPLPGSCCGAGHTIRACTLGRHSKACHSRLAPSTRQSRSAVPSKAGSTSKCVRTLRDLAVMLPLSAACCSSLLGMGPRLPGDPRLILDLPDM